MKWIKNPDSENRILGEFLAERFGTEEPAKLHRLDEWKVPLLDNVAERITEAINRGEFIQIVADYDCDGVMSAAEFELIFRYYEYPESSYNIRLPKRMSEGYGLSAPIIDEISKRPMGLLILVDNGISCISEINEMRNLGWDTIIMDHHLAPEDGIVPEADILVDPAAFHDQADFPYYCGAGLVYKLAEIMVDNPYTLGKILSCAAIATVADAVPLVDTESHTYDNWLIVREGMRKCLEGNMVTQGLYCLLRAAGCDRKLDETDIGFKIAPLVNAPGRLLDQGAEMAFNLVISDSGALSDYDDRAQKLIELNNLRKKTLTEIMERVRPEVSLESNVLSVYASSVNEGVLGLIAGRLAEEYRISTIVLSGSQTLRGSARAYGSFDMKSFLDRISSELESFGGHRAAAGLSVRMSAGETPEDAFARFKARVNAEAGPYVSAEPVIVYDADVAPDEAEHMLELESSYAPFGQGNPAPVYRMSGALQTRRGVNHILMGAEKKAIKLYLPGVDAVNFSGDGRIRFEEEFYPESVSLVGSLSWNEFAGRKSVQMIFTDLKQNGECL